jgi:hypothetical protein
MQRIVAIRQTPQELPVLTSSASIALVMCLDVIEEDAPAARKAACKAALRI